jgi:hypothetical protein
MHQEILRQSSININTREEMKEIPKLMQPWTKIQKLRDLHQHECSELNFWNKEHPRHKQRIASLTLTDDQFDSKFLKKKEPLLPKKMDRQNHFYWR